MSLIDARGLCVSQCNAHALDLYERALLEFQSYRGDAVKTIEGALNEYPGFVLGHLFRAGALLTFGEKRVMAEARASVEVAEGLVARANDRERLLLAALRACVDGNFHLGAVRMDELLVHWPRDAFTVQTAHIMDFLLGDALNLRNRISRVLPNWSPLVPGYSYVLGMHAFGLEECNEYAAAESAGRTALDIEPRDGWAIHAVTHVMEMQGRVDEGIRWLEQRAGHWAPDNGFAFHNWWHLALFHLDRGNVDEVFRLYDQQIYPTPIDACLTLIDATALLWRLWLLGIDVGDRAVTLAGVWQRRMADESDYYAFNDFHAVLAMLMAGRQDQAEAVIASLQQTAEQSRTQNRAMSAGVGLPLSRAALAFAQDRYGECVEHALPVRDTAHRFGGSHAQRDLITLTIVTAAIRGGQSRLANHLLGERTVHRPASALGWRLRQPVAVQSTSANVSIHP